MQEEASELSETHDDEAIFALIEDAINLANKAEQLKCRIVYTSWDNKCTRCDARFEYGHADKMNFCPNCGAEVLKDEI